MGFAAAAAAAVIGAGVAVSEGQKNRKLAKTQAAQQRADAEKAAAEADRAYNRSNPKAPNIAALMQRNEAAGGSGVASTYLTGPQGAPATQGMLGRSTLLGR